MTSKQTTTFRLAQTIDGKNEERDDSVDQAQHGKEQAPPRNARNDHQSAYTIHPDRNTPIRQLFIDNHTVRYTHSSQLQSRSKIASDGTISIAED
jgi:hypothetical protein